MCTHANACTHLCVHTCNTPAHVHTHAHTCTHVHTHALCRAGLLEVSMVLAVGSHPRVCFPAGQTAPGPSRAPGASRTTDPRAPLGGLDMGAVRAEGTGASLTQALPASQEPLWPPPSPQAGPAPLLKSLRGAAVVHGGAHFPGDSGCVSKPTAAAVAIPGLPVAVSEWTLPLHSNEALAPPVCALCCARSVLQHPRPLADPQGRGCA